MPSAHVAGVPIEETIGLYGPVLLLVLSAAAATVGIRLRQVRDRRSSGRRREPGQ